MKNTGSFEGTWQSGNHRVKVNLPLILFEDSNSTITYCPALEVSGYGLDDNQSIESFKIALAEFINYTIKKNTLRDELKRLGWTLKKSKTKPMIPPTLSRLLEDNENFSNIFNNFPFRKINETIELPC